MGSVYVMNGWCFIVLYRGIDNNIKSVEDWLSLFYHIKGTVSEMYLNKIYDKKGIPFIIWDKNGEGSFERKN